MNGWDQREPVPIGLEECLTSAVIVPLIHTDEGWKILLEIRSSKIDRQPGDICLPGGMMEPGETDMQAAIREACEELCIQPDMLNVLGPLDYLYTGTMAVYPFAAVLSDYQGTFSREEVARTVLVPAGVFRPGREERFRMALKTEPPEDFPYDRIAGGKNYRWLKRREDVFFYQYEDITIWGITAKILRSFAHLLELAPELFPENVLEEEAFQ